MRRVAVVGDTANDLQSGANADARWVIGVLNGAHGVAEQGRVQNTHLIASVAGSEI